MESAVTVRHSVINASKAGVPLTERARSALQPEKRPVAAEARSRTGEPPFDGQKETRLIFPPDSLRARLTAFGPMLEGLTIIEHGALERPLKRKIEASTQGSLFLFARILQQGSAPFYAALNAGNPAERAVPPAPMLDLNCGISAIDIERRLYP